jgi:hypothetical protein
MHNHDRSVTLARCPWRGEGIDTSTKLLHPCQGYWNLCVGAHEVQVQATEVDWPRIITSTQANFNWTPTVGWPYKLAHSPYLVLHSRVAPGPRHQLSLFLPRVHGPTASRTCKFRAELGDKGALFKAWTRAIKC